MSNFSPVELFQTNLLFAAGLKLFEFSVKEYLLSPSSGIKFISFYSTMVDAKKEFLKNFHFTFIRGGEETLPVFLALY